jgi:omega-6 fatty acid desaturase (delta-12 desaturase)
LSIGHNLPPAAFDARRWTPILSRYRNPSTVRSAAELAITLLPLVALWITAWLAYWLGYGWVSLLSPVRPPVFSFACS